MNARQVHRLPEGTSYLAGALSEPLACCVHAVLELTAITPGDWVVITGPGTIGLLCLQLARAAGGRTIVSGTRLDAERLKAARRLGADRSVYVDRSRRTPSTGSPAWAAPTSFSNAPARRRLPGSAWP